MRHIQKHTNWNVKEQQPRERLLRLGTDALSDQELLSIVLGSGSPGHSVGGVAGNLLRLVRGSLRRLFHSAPQTLQEVPGLGNARYCTLVAGMELGRRMASRTEKLEPSVNSAARAYQILREYVAHRQQETIVALFLDNRNRVLCFDEVAVRHQPAGSELDLRKLLKITLNRNAASLILAHNHPSGERKASSEDIAMSEDLARLLSSMGVELLDHLVITADGYERVPWRAAG